MRNKGIHAEGNTTYKWLQDSYGLGRIYRNFPMDHGIVENLPMEPILIPATHTDKSPSGHPPKNVTKMSAVGTLNAPRQGSALALNGVSDHS